MASRIQLHELPQETLNIDDIQKVFEELLPAQIVSFYLGIRLRLLHFVVEAIHKEYLQPRDRLYRVLEKFLQKVEPRPTWRVIVDALKCPTVDLPQLAEKIERKYCPNPLPGMYMHVLVSRHCIPMASRRGMVIVYSVVNLLNVFQDENFFSFLPLCLSRRHFSTRGKGLRPTRLLSSPFHVHMHHPGKKRAGSQD